MKWTKDTADTFLKLVSDRDAASSKLSGFCSANSIGAEINAGAEAQIYIDGFNEAKAQDALPVGAVPDEVQNMVLVNGWWTSVPGWQGKAPAITSLRYKLAGVDYSKTVSVRFTRNSFYPRAGNLKFLRVWNNADGVRYPNFYVGQPSPAELFVYSELLNIDRAANHIAIAQTAFPIGDGKDHNEHYQWTYPSAFGKTDGRFLIEIDGVTVLDCKTWQCEGVGGLVNYQGLPFDLFIQDYSANLPVLPDTATVKIKDDVRISVS